MGRVSDSVTRQSHCENHTVGATNSPRITGRMYWANLSPLQSNAYFFCILVFKQPTLVGVGRVSDSVTRQNGLRNVGLRYNKPDLS